jgi:amino acid transporter/nucleotide-binding universal stress UspA family protein
MGSGSEAAGDHVEVKLKRDLGLLEVVMIGLGPTLGSTIFLLVGFGLEIAGPGIILVLTLNFVVIIFTATAYAELSSAFPDTGGGYLWVKEGLPPPFGFLAGWMSWFGHCIVTSFYVLGFGKGILWILEANGSIPETFDGDLVVKALAVCVCIVFIIINYRGTKETGRSGIIITIILLSIIITFIVACAVFIAQGNGNGDVGAIISDPMPNGFSSIFVAMGFTFIIYEGFEIISQCGEECKDPLKNVPRATWLCIIISTFIFILVALVCMGVVDWSTIGVGTDLIRGEDVVAEAAGLALPGGIILIGVGVILGTLAAVNSTLFSSSRVSFAMGRDKTLPKSFGKLHEKRHTPHVAIITSGFIIIIMTLLLPIAEIAASTSIMFLLLFLFVNISVMTLRYKRPDIKRHYLMPLFPVIPIIGIITLLVLAAALWEEYHLAWFIALLWILIGLITYYFYGGKKTIETIEPEEEPKGLIETIIEKREEKDYKILVPVAREDQKELVEFAALVARAEDAELQVSTVIELPSSVPLDSLGYKETSPHIKLVEKLKKASNRELVKSDGSVLVSHSASTSILDTVKEENINLLVLGWKGRTTEGRLFGVVLDKLIQNADCDVVVFKTPGLKKEIKKILVVSTPEWHVTYATSYAVLFAKRDEADVTIFSASTSKEAMTKEEKYADKLTEICKTHDVPFEKKVVMTDSIEQAILDEAAGYDLVVMGASDEWKQKHHAFGRLQDRVARAVNTPILMVRKVR